MTIRTQVRHGLPDIKLDYYLIVQLSGSFSLMTASTPIDLHAEWQPPASHTKTSALCSSVAFETCQTPSFSRAFWTRRLSNEPCLAGCSR